MERMTRLDAINSMLQDIRMAPVASLVDLDAYHEATLASHKLTEKTREVLSRGWIFNTTEISLDPDPSTSKIQVPSYTAALDVYAHECNPRVIMGADGYLTDFHNNTQEFSQSVAVSIVRSIAFESLPTPLQNLCLKEARMAFYGAQRSGENAPDIMRLELLDAKALAAGWDARQRRYSMLDNLESRVHVNRNIPRRRF